MDLKTKRPAEHARRGKTPSLNLPEEMRVSAFPDIADLAERLIEACPQRLGVPPRKGQLAAYAVPELSFLLDHQYTKTGTCQHTPER